MGQHRIGGRASVRGAVVIVGQFIACTGHQPQSAVEARAVDVKDHRLIGRNGDGIILHAAVGRRHDSRVRGRGRTGDGRVGAEVEGAGQGNGRADAAIGRVVALDDVRGAAALAGCAREELVRATAAAEGVDATPAAQDVGVCVTRQGIGIGRTGHVLDLGQGVEPRTEVRIAVCQVNHHPGARAGVVGRIVARPAVQRVVAQSADQDVIAVAAVQRVVAGAAVQIVVPGQTVDGVVPTQTADDVRQGRAGDGLIGDVAADHDAARRGRRYRLVSELQELDIGHGHVLTVADDRAGLSGPGDGVGGPRAREHNRIGPEAAVDDVRAGVGGEPVVGGVAAEGVRAAAADGVLDHRAEGDRDVADQAADAGEGTLAQINDLAVVQIAREVERIRAAGVPGAEDQGAEFIAGVEPELARRRVEAIDGVAGPGRHIGAVQALGGRDIVQKRRGRIALRAGAVGAEVSRGRPLGEITHHRILEGVLVVDRTGVIGDDAARTGVVGGRMTQADGVPDLVQQGELAVALLNRQGVVGQRTVDPHVALDLAEAGAAGHAAGQIGKGGRAGLTGAVVAQQDGGVVGEFASGVLDALEGDVGHVRPGGERQNAGGDLGGVELREAGRIGRHGRDRVTEGVGHRRRCAESCGPALVAARDLGAGVG